MDLHRHNNPEILVFDIDIAMEKICSLPPKSIAVSSLPLKNTNFLGCHSFRFFFASFPFRKFYTKRRRCPSPAHIPHALAAHAHRWRHGSSSILATPWPRPRTGGGMQQHLGRALAAHRARPPVRRRRRCPSLLPVLRRACCSGSGGDVVPHAAARLGVVSAAGASASGACERACCSSPRSALAAASLDYARSRHTCAST
jgi:hypothetical protein